MDSEAFKRVYIMLRPMVSGASGFAKLEAAADRVRLAAHLKGLKSYAHGVRVFAYGGEGDVQELGHAEVGREGQSSFLADTPAGRWSVAPARLQAVMLVSDAPAPRPLLLGLLTQQSAGSVLEAKSAMEALCLRLNKTAPRPTETPAAVAAPTPVAEPTKTEASVAATEPTKADVLVPPVPQEPNAVKSEVRQAAQAPKRVRVTIPVPPAQTVPPEAHLTALPREALLTAVDPSPYTVAMEPPAHATLQADPSATLPALERPKSLQLRHIAPHPRSPRTKEESSQAQTKETDTEAHRRPLDGLFSVVWPPDVADLKGYFDRYPPVAPFAGPGWRYVRAPMSGPGENGSFCIGAQTLDGRVRRIAYAVPGTRDQPPPSALGQYQWRRGMDDEGYWTHEKRL